MTNKKKPHMRPVNDVFGQYDTVIAPGAIKNSTKKVDIVVHENGERVVVGEAVVEIEDDYIGVTAHISDPKYMPNFVKSDPSFSLGPFKAHPQKE